MKRWIGIGILVVIIVIFNFLILNQENKIKNSDTIYFRLDPVDPRSLMQGDYMVLHYEMIRNLRSKVKKINKEGYIVVEIDKNNVAQFKRLDKSENNLQINERIIKYKSEGWRIKIGIETYFFQEGQGRKYETAKYAEVKVSKDGDVYLMRLKNKNLKTIK